MNLPKGNICACEYLIKRKTDQKIQTKTSISFHAQWKIMWTELFFMSERNVISSKFHFGSHVNSLLILDLKWKIWYCALTPKTFWQYLQSFSRRDGYWNQRDRKILKAICFAPRNERLVITFIKNYIYKQREHFSRTYQSIWRQWTSMENIFSRLTFCK